MRGWAAVADGEADALAVEIGEGPAANVIEAAKSRNVTSVLVFMRKESSRGRVARANYYWGRDSRRRADFRRRAWVIGSEDPSPRIDVVVK